MFRLFFPAHLLVLFFFLWGPLPTEAAGPSPSDLVEKFQANLLEVMKEAESSNVRQRFDHLSPIVEETFHLPLMIQIATGSYWKEATTSERIELVRAFRRMSISILATLFDGYSGEVFKLTGEKPGPQKTLLVVTKLIKTDKSTVDIAYVLRSIKDRWRIIDVVLDNGISELMVRRSEYHLILKNKGIPGLISLLNTKADGLISK
ncbi:MAG: ABC transporter substrate-binding protein [Rhodospirillales bacterium]|nr:ABC transporter substrate-binding protein [Rhodospirillales bacterium]